MLWQLYANLSMRAWNAQEQRRYCKNVFLFLLSPLCWFPRRWCSQILFCLASPCPCCLFFLLFALERIFFYDFINRFLSELGCKNYLQLIGTIIFFWEGRQFLHFCFATKICITGFNYRNLVTFYSVKPMKV